MPGPTTAGSRACSLCHCAIPPSSAVSPLNVSYDFIRNHYLFHPLGSYLHENGRFYASVACEHPAPGWPGWSSLAVSLENKTKSRQGPPQAMRIARIPRYLFHQSPFYGLSLQLPTAVLWGSRHLCLHFLEEEAEKPEGWHWLTCQGQEHCRAFCLTQGVKLQGPHLTSRPDSSLYFN